MTSRQEERELEELLGLLRENRGIDLTGYKRTTLVRRLARRMSLVGAASVAAYREYLEVQPDEYGLLLDSLLINVTAFFRDGAAWDALRDQVIPELRAAKPPGTPIRVWSAGCATGEEAYTLAMVLADAVGVDAFRECVKIYATDLDQGALQIARAGVYDERRTADLPEELKDRFFEPVDGGFVFRRDLRRQLIFGRNNLTSDAPISRVDLLVIRNTLMYFNAETQAAILRRLHFALSDSGYLFLGKAEMLINQGESFEAVDLRKRLFQKIPRSSLRPEILRRPVSNEGEVVRMARLQAALLGSGPIAHLALDTDGFLVLANSRAEALFGLRPMDIGRPFQDLALSYRPVELRSVIERVNSELAPITLKGVQWQRPPKTEPDIFDVVVTPLFDALNNQIGIGIGFTDVTLASRLTRELEHANTELERTQLELYSLNEELETTNEELQSTNEELETTNEELQSSNEELETMNEELQSTNDELQEINDTLRIRTAEVGSANTFLESVLESLGTAVILLDDALRVTDWGPGAEELWGLRSDEACGRELISLDIGLPVAEVAEMVRRIREQPERSPETTELDAVNRRGRPIRLRLDALLLRGKENTNGVILIANL